jgi:hypothetical protein
MTQEEADKNTRAMRAVLKTLFQLQAQLAIAARQAPPLPFDDDGRFVSFI